MRSHDAICTIRSHDAISQCDLTMRSHNAISRCNAVRTMQVAQRDLTHDTIPRCSTMQSHNAIIHTTMEFARCDPTMRSYDAIRTMRSQRGNLHDAICTMRSHATIQSAQCKPHNAIPRNDTPNSPHDLMQSARCNSNDAISRMMWSHAQCNPHDAITQRFRCNQNDSIFMIQWRPASA